MRIWSLHPKYLDSKGLVALWRETLLAKNVLLNNTKGYRNHPQLLRFKHSENPVTYINLYLHYVHKEACDRKYNFNKEKIGKFHLLPEINVSEGQMAFEFRHLLSKLKSRDPKQYDKIARINKPEPHPIFHIVSGDIEGWEKI